ncbi:MAG: D-tyrosyl-tRNA(Tyr) deacylase [Bacilli bacterium]|nr:D-tyrosyl-tRNA(Tyr) deacylase [Bacilli bacterium]
MKVIIQRVKESSVSINNEVYNSINNGFMILVGFTEGDTSIDIDYIIKKIVNLRIFDDESGIMNKSIIDVGGSILSISQFTLYADTKKGNRPSYIKALKGELSTKLYDEFNEKLNKIVPTKTGIFGADMKVSLINDGPVTIIIDSKDK